MALKSEILVHELKDYTFQDSTIYWVDGYSNKFCQIFGNQLPVEPDEKICQGSERYDEKW